MKASTAIAATFVALAALVLTSPTPASATTAAAPAVQYGKAHAGVVQEVGRRYYRGRRYVRPYYGYGYRPYYGYGYRPYYGYGYAYPRYGYYRPYYRPYAYYGGYGYRSWRPGISFGFAF